MSSTTARKKKSQPGAVPTPLPRELDPIHQEEYPDRDAEEIDPKHQRDFATPDEDDEREDEERSSANKSPA